MNEIIKKILDELFGIAFSGTVDSMKESKEPLNNKPYILVKHAIQAFFQNTGLIGSIPNFV